MGLGPAPRKMSEGRTRPHGLPQETESLRFESDPAYGVGGWIGSVLAP